MTEFRNGIGYDRHVLKPGSALVLAGIVLPHSKSLLGHSDGDVVFHALVDALLGGGALGDIGTHFPDTDPQWKGVKSEIFLQKTVEMLRQNKFEITFIDCIILAEKPKLSPYFSKMKANISRIIKLSEDRISLKAKTEEGMDSIGREESIAAFASATLKREDLG